MDKLDFKNVASAALAAADNLLAEWLPSGRYKGHEFYALNPTRADKHLGSFVVNTHTGQWSDFATGDSGGDLISLYAYCFTNGNQGEAMKAVAERLRIGDFSAVEKKEWDGVPNTAKPRRSWTAIIPFDEARLQTLSGARCYQYAKGSKAEGLRAVYRDAGGRPLCVVQRFVDEEGGKSDLPFVWAQSDDGVQAWANRRPAAPTPLFGLDDLAAKPDAPVLVVEGEKCRMAAQDYWYLKDWAVISWLGGCNGWKTADWLPLSGREVIIWPDCDGQREKLSKQGRDDGLSADDMPYLPWLEQPGMKAALGIAEKLEELECAVKIVPVPPPGDWPSGYDIADVIQDTEPLASVAEMMDRAVAWPLPEGFTPPSFRRLWVEDAPSENARTETAGGGGGEGAGLAELAEDVPQSSDLLENYAQIGLKEKALNLHTGETFSRSQLEKVFSRPLVAAWLRFPERKTLSELQSSILIKQKKLEAMAVVSDDFKDALNRYIYLDGTTDAFDRHLQCIVSLAAVKAAIPEEFEDWCKSPGRLVCPMKNYVFDPSMSCGVVMDEKKGEVRHINMFTGLPVKAEEPDIEVPTDMPLEELIGHFPKCGHIIGLIRHLCAGNGDLSADCTEWVLNWLACRFRRPHEKPATALVFISETQGVGKSTFGEKVVKRLFGDYLRQLDQNALESRFNAALLFALVTIFEEISPSDERLNVIGKLKNMITSDVIMVERKGRDAERHNDFNSFIIFSNDERSIPIESNDRRFMVLSCNRKYSDEQYEDLAAEIENGGIEEFARFLCALPLMYTAERIRTEGGWQPVRRAFTPHSKPLPTPIKRRMVNLNKPSWEAFLDDWRCGDLDLPFISCAAGDLWQVYKAWCANTKTFHMQQKNFYANIGKRLADCRSTVKIRGQNRTLRFFAVPHQQLSETNRAKYPLPNTDCTARDAAAAVSKADYYGRQIEDFNIAAELPNI